MAHSQGDPQRTLPSGRTFADDLRRAWTEIRRAGVWRTIRRTFEDLQEFYLTPERRLRLAAMGKVKRWIYLAGWLLTSLFLKLTPARRVLLIASFVFLGTSVQIDQTSHGFRMDLPVPYLGVTLLLITLMLELKDKLTAREELEAGRKVQRALMPDPSPSVRGWDLWLFTRPANDVGGDLVDYLAVDSARFGVMLADVAGKGLPAALLMAKVQSTLRALVPDASSLSALGARVNRILYRDGLPNRFATLTYLEVRLDSGEIGVLNAGHMPAWRVTGTTCEQLPKGGFALGMMPEATFAEHRTSLSPGELLLVYSDGLTEAMNAEGQFFGDERLRPLLPGLAVRSAREAGETLVAAVDEFVGETKPFDDLSIIVLRRLG